MIQRQIASWGESEASADPWALRRRDAPVVVTVSPKLPVRATTPGRDRE